MEDLFWIGFVGAAIALLFAWLQRSRVMSFSDKQKFGRILANTFKNDSLGIVCRADGKHITLRSNTLSCKAEMPESYNARHACNT